MAKVYSVEFNFTLNKSLKLNSIKSVIASTLEQKPKVRLLEYSVKELGKGRGSDALMNYLLSQTSNKFYSVSAVMVFMSDKMSNGEKMNAKAIQQHLYPVLPARLDEKFNKGANEPVQVNLINLSVKD